MLDFCQAHVAQVIAISMGGKKTALNKFLLLRRQKGKQDPETIMAIMKATLG